MESPEFDFPGFLYLVEFQNKELKKRTRCIRVFPNRESLLRIASALLIELDEFWLAEAKVYIAG